MRAVWKGVFFKLNNTLHKSSTLLNTTLKQKFSVHDGKTTRHLLVNRSMIGLKVGEFVFTRKVGVEHKKKKKNKKGKKK